MLSEKTRAKFKKRRERILNDIKKPHLTLESIGLKFGVTKQRVRQIALEFGINRQIENREAASMTFHKIMVDFKLGASIAEITKKYKISREDLSYLHRQFAPTEPTLISQYRTKRNKAIVDLFKNGDTAKTITNKTLKVLDDPTKILSINTIYGITTKHGVKRYPKVGNRTSGICFEKKSLLNLIVKLYERKSNPLTFEAIANHLNSKGYKTLGGKVFNTQIVYQKYKMAKKHQK